MNFFYLCFSMFILTFSVNSTFSYTENEPLIIDHADRFEFFKSRGRTVQKLIGNVCILHKNTITKADTAYHYKHDSKIIFSGNVLMAGDGKNLFADYVLYLREKKEVFIKGNVKVVDTLDGLVITGGRAWHFQDLKKIRITDSPMLIKPENNGDSLVIISKTMEHYGTKKLALAIDDVVITSNNMESKCGIAEYYKIEEKIILLKSPICNYNNSFLKGDTIIMYFADDSLKKIEVFGNASMYSREKENKSTDSSNITKIWGDTIFVNFSNGDIDSSYILGNALAESWTLADSVKKDWIKGKKMKHYMHKHVLDSMFVWGNASSCFYDRNSNDNGVNKTQGQKIKSYFKESKFNRVIVQDGVVGSFLSRKK